MGEAEFYRTCGIGTAATKMPLPRYRRTRDGVTDEYRTSSTEDKCVLFSLLSTSSYQSADAEPLRRVGHIVPERANPNGIELGSQGEGFPAPIQPIRMVGVGARPRGTVAVGKLRSARVHQERPDS